MTLQNVAVLTIQCSVILVRKFKQQILNEEFSNEKNTRYHF